ncbi:MAG TPA: AAA family ATPase, partial [Bacteroidia bacterium]|nr:AAA family ATPase [Bacteroidia bacterium]
LTGGVSSAAVLPQENALVTQPETLDELLAKLDALIGLESVKKNIKDHINYLNFLKLRKEKGFEEKTTMGLHAVFSGNPGTGKTTVVKMLGQIYQRMGLLSKGHVMEVDRVDLVGEYLGQTAPKVKKAINDARGGILFIDEAYSLARAGLDSKDFGKEVIEILIKEMSDGKGDIAIMCAGYPKEMQGFVDANPGLRSRFTHYFNFDDYQPDELMLIAEGACVKKSVTLSPEARNLLANNLTLAYRSRTDSFGNARFACGVIEEAEVNLGLRLMNHTDITSLSKEEMSVVEAEDVAKVFASQGVKKLHLEVDEKLLKEALSELDELTGMASVKKDVNELVKLVRFYKETGKDVLNKFSLHSVFTGNPGTGKTTVARIIAKIYKGLGLLERGHVVEVDREGLVAGFIGQTAIKTADKVQQAMGGVLFIDEAYALSGSSHDSDYGHEAIEVILKRMEDERGRFAVIAAGYPENMKQFLESNPGLKSRFDRTYSFQDYAPEELYTIARHLFAAEQIKPDAGAEVHLKAYFMALHDHRDKHFGNARSVRQVVGEAVKNQNLRLASLEAASRTKEMLNTLTLEDVKDFVITEGGNDRTRIGFKG